MKNTDTTKPKAQDKQQETRNDKAAEPKEQFVPSGTQEKKVTYNKPKVDHETIAKLKEASDSQYQTLITLVEKLLKSQGKSHHHISAGNVKVDDATRRQAQAAIADDGPLSAEAVSDRIVSFAKGISGGDIAKFDELKAAIEEGFSQARAIFGGQLPDISNKTYDLVMEKLDKWKEEATRVNETA